MSDVVADLAVRVGADVSSFNRDMRKADGTLNRFGANAAKNAKRIAKIGVASTGLATVFFLAVKKAVELADEIGRLSDIAGTNVEQFQRMSYAAGLYGVEQEKLADILKDTSDKMGDFLVTGGGPLVDFFENVAPKVGLTADAFRNLSSDEILQKYVDGLEAANLSQEKMTFYLEAIASDAKALEPLLSNNGKRMGELADEADRLGLVLDAQVIAQAREAHRELETLKDVIGTQFTAALIKAGPMLAEFAGRFSEALPKIAAVVDKLLQWVGVMDLPLDLQFENKDKEFMRGVEKLAAQQKVVEDLFGALPGSEGWGDAIANAPSPASIEELYKLEDINAALDQVEIELNDILIRKAEADERHAQLFRLFDPESNEDDETGDPLAAGKTDPLVGDLEALAEGLMSKNELLMQHHEEQNALLEAAKLKGYLTEEKYQELRTALAKQHAQERAGLQKSENTWLTSETNQMFSDLASLSSTGNKKLFAISKAASAAQTIVSTYSAAQKQFEALSANPPLAYAAAGAAIAAGLARLNSIKNQTMGGSSSGGGGGFSRSAPSASAVAAPEAASAVERTVSVFFEGDRDGTVSRSSMLNFIEQLNDALDDGANLRTAR